MNESFFVTGATGFIGSHLIDLLSKKNYKITCFIENGADLKWIKRYIDSNAIDIFIGDCRNKVDLKRALTHNVDYIIHLAGITDSKNPEDYFNINYTGTKNLLEICLENNIILKRFVYVSSVAAAGPSRDGCIIKDEDAFKPITDYGKSKLEAEKEIKKFSTEIPYTILRPSLVFGPRNRGTIFSFFQFASYGLKPNIGEGLTNVIHVKDLANIILVSATSKITINKSYFIGETKQYSYSEIGDIIATSLGKKTISINFPRFSVLMAGAILGGISKLFGKYPVFDLRRAKDLKYRYWIYDVNPFFNDTGYKIKYPFTESVKETTEWYRKAGWLK